MGSSKGLVSTMNRCVRLYRRSVPERVEVHLPGSKSITNRALVAAALAEGIAALLENPTRGRALGERGRERVASHFRPDAHLDRLLEILR